MRTVWGLWAPPRGRGLAPLELKGWHVGPQTSGSAWHLLTPASLQLPRHRAPPCPCPGPSLLLRCLGALPSEELVLTMQV